MGGRLAQRSSLENGCTTRTLRDKKPWFIGTFAVAIVIVMSYMLFAFEGPQVSLPMTTRIAFASHTSKRIEMSQNRPAFPPYQHPNIQVPAWIITSWNTSSVHRFFDSSPFSPSGRYVGVTRLFSEGTIIDKNSMAEIIVVDLNAGTERAVAKTHAFDSQVGAHVQWGNSDEELYYNDVIRSRKNNHPTIMGVRLNMFTGEKRYFDCGIYALSPDGKYAATPNLALMPVTQKGYGVRLEKKYVTPHTHASNNDGLRVVDLSTGKCSLVASFRNIAKKTGLNPDYPTYGFHVKWNALGDRIMFVVRQFRPKSGVLGFFAESRRNHIITMKPDGSDMKMAVAWGAEGGDIRNGNHPNWMPDGRTISMNLAFIDDVKSGKIQNMNEAKSWSIVAFHEDGSKERRLHRAGSGHPVVLPFETQRYLVTDVYAKEQRFFPQLAPGESPLRLIDTRLHKEVWLLKANIVPNEQLWRQKHPHVKFPLNDVREKGPWRCDMHPAFDKSNSWVALNVRPDGGFRQVMIAYVGNDPGRFFAYDN